MHRVRMAPVGSARCYLQARDARLVRDGAVPGRCLECGHIRHSKVERCPLTTEYPARMTRDGPDGPGTFPLPTSGSCQLPRFQKQPGASGSNAAGRRAEHPSSVARFWILLRLLLRRTICSELVDHVLSEFNHWGVKSEVVEIQVSK